MYKVTRPEDDGRLSFGGCHFKGNDIFTESASVAKLAKDIGWKVEEVIHNDHIAEASELVFTCPTCQKECKNKLGLLAHMRSHNG